MLEVVSNVKKQAHKQQLQQQQAAHQGSKPGAGAHRGGSSQVRGLKGRRWAAVRQGRAPTTALSDLQS